MTSVRLPSLVATAFALAACVTPAELGGDAGSDSEETGDGDGDTEGDGDGDTTAPPDPPDVPGSDCGPLQHVLTIDLGEVLELSAGSIEAVDLTEDGGILAAQVSNQLDPAVHVHRFDATGDYMFSVERDWIKLSNAGTRLRAQPSGAFALLGPTLPQPSIVIPVVEMFDAAGASLWTWTHPMPGEGLDTRFVDIGADGQVMSAGGSEPYGANFTWVQLLEADGSLGPQLGGAGAEGILLGEMQLGGAALAPNGNILLAGRLYDPNDLWVAELDLEGAVVWQTKLSPGDLAIEELLVAADGTIHVASVSKLYLLDPNGELLYVNSWLGGGDLVSVTLLGGADPLVLMHMPSGVRLSHLSPVGALIDLLDVESIVTPTVVRSDGSCRAVVGGIPAQVQVFEG